jgi:hypothetical protein
LFRSAAVLDSEEETGERALNRERLRNGRN